MSIEARGGLIEDQHPRRQIDGAGDRDEMLHRDGIFAERHADIDVQGRTPRNSTAGVAGASRRRCTTPKRVGWRPRNRFSRDRKIGQEVDLLIDGGDACIRARPWPSAARYRRRRGEQLRHRAATTPVTALIRVDLPAPFSPSNAWISPARRVKSTSSSARSAPKLLLSPRTSRRARAGSEPLSMASLLPPASATDADARHVERRGGLVETDAPAGLIDGGAAAPLGQ